ncbi:MAG: right-handed parallel beta-helix repeat-containing protein [Acidobacteriota bacterium]|nr:right-handed parallel beta-helix repeat-containing protein [Acidobacteriota bacterium]
MRFTKPAVAAVAFFLIAGTANAATWYVAASGNDANAGSLASPFKTITKAASRVAAGDVVEVRGGVYNEVVKISSKGTASARITFRPYSGEVAAIDGTGSAPDTNLVQFNSAEFVDFTGFEVRNATRLGICGYPAKSVRVLNNKIHGSYRNGIYFGSSSSDITIDGNDVYNNVLENRLRNMSSGWGQALAVNKTNGATITNNRVYRNYGEGIDFVVADNGVARGNEVYDNFSVGIYLDNARYTTIDRNFVYSTGDTSYYRDGEPASGIGIANENYSLTSPSTGNVIKNNIVLNTKWGFYYGAYDLGGGLKNTTVSNNTFYQSTFAAIWIQSDTHVGSLVQNNIFHQVGGRAVADVAGAGVIYRSNNWFGGSAGGAAGTGDVIGDPGFVNAGGLRAVDYKIVAGSRPIEAGLDVTSIVSNDYFGNPRSIGIDIGAHEYSLFSNAQEVIPDTQAPTVPERLAGKVTSTVSLTWRASTDNVAVTAYEIFRDGVRVAKVTDWDWTDGNVTAGSTYRYQVSAIDAAGNASAKSAAITVQTPVQSSRTRSAGK